MTTPAPMAADYAHEYAAVEARVARLVSESDADRPVEACPGWRVRDVLSHLLGVCEDWQRGRFDRYASDEWTAAQLVRHDGTAFEVLLDDWRRCLEEFGAVTGSPFGGSPASWAFGDAIIHEADLRGALAEGRVPEAPVRLAMGGMTARWHDRLERAGTPCVRVLSQEGEEWLVGHPKRPVVELEVTVYELFRGLAGRRSSAQVRAWPWSDDPEPILAAGLPYPFRWASRPLDD